MSATARDVVAMELWRCKDKADANGKKLTASEFTDAILSALDAAGFAVAPKALLKPKVNAKAFARLDEMAEADIAMDGDHALSILLKHYRELTAAKEPTP